MNHHTTQEYIHTMHIHSIYMQERVTQNEGQQVLQSANTKIFTVFYINKFVFNILTSNVKQLA